MKVGPLYVAKHSLTLYARGFGVGVAGRSTLSGQFTGWRLLLDLRPLNRCLSMSIDKPSVGRYHW